MLNPSPSLLDAAQIVKRVFDGANDVIRTEISSNSGIAITLDPADDGVTTYPSSYSAKASITSASTGVILPAFSAVGLKSFNLFTNTTSTLTGPQACTLEISPSDTDNVWVATSVTVTESTTSGTAVAATATSGVVARRARVSIASAISSGTFDIYVTAQSV